MTKNETVKLASGTILICIGAIRDVDNNILSLASKGVIGF